jgi:hypothetical protein
MLENVRKCHRMFKKHFLTFRAFEVWMPNTSASRIANAVWWFMHDVSPAVSSLQMDSNHAYPPTRNRPKPKPNGADLIGCAFIEPEIGVCHITVLGTVTRHTMPTRAQTQWQRVDDEPAIQPGANYTLTYTQASAGDDHFSSIAEILNWIASGPIQQPTVLLVPSNGTTATITTPAFVPATIQYVPHHNALPATPPTLPARQQRMSVRNEVGKKRVSERIEIGHERLSEWNESRNKRVSERNESRNKRVSDRNDNNDRTHERDAIG